MKKIKELDFFAASVPTINLNGKTQVKTWAGATASMLILALTFIFGLFKLEQLALRKNATINTFKDHQDEGAEYDTGSEDFMMAFSAVGFISGEAIHDPRLVRWYVRFRGSINGE